MFGGVRQFVDDRVFLEFSWCCWPPVWWTKSDVGSPSLLSLESLGLSTPSFDPLVPIRPRTWNPVLPPLFFQSSSSKEFFCTSCFFNRPAQNRVEELFFPDLDRNIPLTCFSYTNVIQEDFVAHLTKLFRQVECDPDYGFLLTDRSLQIRTLRLKRNDPRSAVNAQVTVPG